MVAVARALKVELVQARSAAPVARSDRTRPPKRCCEPRSARRDALPEHTQYADTGCDIHRSCLTCPLVRCRYDEPGGARRLLSEERDRTILQLQRSEGDRDACGSASRGARVSRAGARRA